MKLNATRLRYWDSCVFLKWLLDEEGADVIQGLLQTLRDQDEAKPDIQIVTSVLTLTEVAYAANEKKQRRLDPETEQRIDHLWDVPYIVVVDLNRRVARQARQLVRRSIEARREDGSTPKILSWPDSIHMATAEWVRRHLARKAELDEFYTYDGDLLTTYAELLPEIQFTEPYIANPRLFD
ncbi:MAG: type II toxin-antitoxin system VapC family toxin [Anaerolineae bacterium]